MQTFYMDITRRARGYRLMHCILHCNILAVRKWFVINKNKNQTLTAYLKFHFDTDSGTTVEGNCSVWGVERDLHIFEPLHRRGKSK